MRCCLIEVVAGQGTARRVPTKPTGAGTCRPFVLAATAPAARYRQPFQSHTGDLRLVTSVLLSIDPPVCVDLTIDDQIDRMQTYDRTQPAAPLLVRSSNIT